MLNELDAMRIYALKSSPVKPKGLESQKSFHRTSRMNLSCEVSKRFGVSPRVVRDIWNGKTWTHATIALRMQPQSKRAISDMELSMMVSL